MNFTGRVEAQEIQVELKYCERCGALWLRPQGTKRVHCESCHACLEARPIPGRTPPRKARRRKSRRQSAGPQTQDIQNSCRIDCLQGIAALEVSA